MQEFSGLTDYKKTKFQENIVIINTAPTTITDMINPITSIFGLIDVLLNSRTCPHFEHFIWSPSPLKV